MLAFFTSHLELFLPILGGLVGTLLSKSSNPTLSALGHRLSGALFDVEQLAKGSK
jgi:hypothetical protein